MQAREIRLGSGPTASRIAVPAMHRATPVPNTNAGVTRFDGNGRFLVRGISASRSRSIHWLTELAPAAESAVPTSVTAALSTTSQVRQGRPTAAITNPTIEVV